MSKNANACFKGVADGQVVTVRRARCGWLASAKRLGSRWYRKWGGTINPNTGKLEKWWIACGDTPEAAAAQLAQALNLNQAAFVAVVKGE